MNAESLRIVSIILVLTILLGPAAFSASEQVVKYNNDGVKAMKVSNYPAAVAAFQQCLKLDPTYKFARENLSICFNNWGISLQGIPAQAIEKFHKSLFYSPDNATGVQNLEVTIRNLGKDPRSFKDRVALGKAARLAGDLEGGIVEFAEALKLKDDPALRVELGNAYYVRDRVDDAINQYNIAAKNPQLDPDVKAKVYRSLGQAYQTKGDYPHSVEAYNVAITLNRTDKEAVEANKAVNLAKHPDLAQPGMNSNNPGQIDVETELRTLNSLHGSDIARTEKYLDGIPESKLLVMQRKCIESGEEKQSLKHLDAIEEFDKALILDNAIKKRQVGLTVQILMKLADSYLQKGDYVSAHRNYEKVLQIQQDYQPAKVNVIRIKDMLTLIDQAKQKQARKEYREAASFYQSALMVAPGNTELTAYLADCYFEQGKIAEARMLYEQLFQKNPKLYVEKLFPLAGIFEKLHCRYDALLTYRKYVCQSSSIENIAKAKERIAILEKEINESVNAERAK